MAIVMFESQCFSGAMARFITLANGRFGVSPQGAG